MFGHTVTVYSSAAAHHRQQYQPGGNLLSVTGAAAGRVKDSGSDEWGRHCWIALGGKRDEGVVFITASASVRKGTIILVPSQHSPLSIQR